jgi:hypothetical protein
MKLVNKQISSLIIGKNFYRINNKVKKLYKWDFIKFHIIKYVMWHS